MTYSTAPAQAQDTCGVDYWLLRWVDDGTAQGVYITLPCPGDVPTPPPAEPWPARVWLTDVRG